MLLNLSTSRKQAVMTSVEKKGRDRRFIKNWRPISLLNVDVKIASMVLARKIKRVISKIVNTDHTAYIEGRNINESTRLIQDMLDYIDKNDEERIFSQLILRKPLTPLITTFFFLFLKHLGSDKI